MFGFIIFLVTYQLLCKTCICNCLYKGPKFINKIRDHLMKTA